MEAGYDPARVNELGRRTVESLEQLLLLTSQDPLAADAIRTIRLTRRNLEDHWMSALRDIESSDAMISWRASRLEGWRGRSLGDLANALPVHLRPDGVSPVGPTRLTDDDRDAMLGRLDWLERTSLGGDDTPGRPTATELDALAEQLAWWVPRDGELRRRLIERSTTNMLVGGLLLRAEFPTSFVSTVIETMSSPNGPDTGVDRERYARSLSDAFAAMVTDPTACLDLLIADHGRILYDITAWTALDTAAISDFVIAGLHTAVAVDPTRLGDGYDALALLTTFTSGPLGRGIGAGVALGVATSMAGYLDKLGRAVRQTGPSERVNIIDGPRGIDASLGSYDDVRGLFGVVLRHPDAQARLGAVTAVWAESTLTTAPSLPVYRRRQNTVAKFAEMLSDAADSEQAEMNMQAAAAEARNRQLAGAIGFVVGTATAGAGATGPLRELFSWTLDIGTTWVGRTEPSRMPGSRLGAQVRRQMTVTAISMALVKPGFFDEGDDDDRPAPLTSTQRRDVEDRLAALGRAVDADDFEHAYDALVSHIDDYVPALRAAAHVADADPSADDLDDD